MNEISGFRVVSREFPKAAKKNKSSGEESSIGSLGPGGGTPVIVRALLYKAKSRWYHSEANEPMVNYILLYKIRKIVKKILRDKIADDELATTPKSCIGCLADDISWEIYYLMKEREGEK